MWISLVIINIFVFIEQFLSSKCHAELFIESIFKSYYIFLQHDFIILSFTEETNEF